MVKVLSYPHIEVNKNEVFRYLRAKEVGLELEAEVNSVIEEILSEEKNLIAYKKFEILRDNGVIDLGFYKTSSENLIKRLEGYSHVLLVLATVGIGIDRLILKYSHVSFFKQAICQAVGSERVESLLDKFCEDVSLSCKSSPRFSPGYGEIPLTLQPKILEILQAEKLLGVTLNDSLIMTPSKSVTAIIGINE